MLGHKTSLRKFMKINIIKSYVWYTQCGNHISITEGKLENSQIGKN